MEPAVTRKPGDKSLAVLIETFQTHYEPMKLFVMETFKFHQRQQAAMESVAEYIAELRKLATYCEFGEHL